MATLYLTSDAGLRAPAAYFGMSPEQKAVVCNGAGPKKFGWLIPASMYGLSITESANIHDFMYAKGYKRKEADTTFRANMKTQIEAGGHWFKWLRRLHAAAYFNTVRLFGGTFYTEA